MGTDSEHTCLLTVDGGKLALFEPSVNSPNLKHFETPLATSPSQNLVSHLVLKLGGSQTTFPISKPEWPILLVSKSPDFENGSIWQVPVLKPELPNGPTV
jgi:hypothetical protein